MKPFVLIAAAALLVTGCQSKKEICANWVAGDAYTYEMGLKYQRKPRNQQSKQDQDGAQDKVWSYCQYLTR